MVEVKSFQFADTPSSGTSDISALDDVSERFVEHLSILMERAARQVVAIEAKDAQSITFAEWIDQLPSLSSISIFRLLPLRGGMMLRFEEEMVAGLIEVHFGGQLGPPQQREKPCFRDVELHFIERLSRSIVTVLTGCFGDSGNMKPLFLRHEAKTTNINLCKPNEQICLRTYQISVDEETNWTIDLIYSAEATQSAVELIQSDGTEQPETTDPVWRDQWLTNLRQIHLPLRTILAQPTMTLPQLFELKAGDIIPIAPRTKPPLFVANHKFATGTLGEKDGCAAYKIDTIEHGEPI